MTTIADEIFRVTGLGVNDGQALQFGRLENESLQDAELRFLNQELIGDEVFTIQDGWTAFAAEQFPEAVQINDIKLAYWSSK